MRKLTTLLSHVMQEMYVMLTKTSFSTETMKVIKNRSVPGDHRNNILTKNILASTVNVWWLGM